MMDYRIMLNQSEIWNMTKTHRHDCLEILLCLNGGGSFFLQDKVFPLQKGTLIVTQENVLHRSIATENGYERYVLYIPKETLLSASGKKTDFISLFHESFCIQTNSESFSKLCSLFEKCYLPSEELGSDVIQDCAFLALLVFVARLVPSSHTDSGENGLSPSVHRAVHWIDTHLEEKITLDLLASHSFVTKFHLCRLFKEETGFTPGEFITQRRILKACALLKQGESVQKAGEATGFQNYNHFIRTFSRAMGISPGRYRCQKKQEKK